MGVSPPPGLTEPSLELLSFLRCSRFSLLLTLVSHVPEKQHRVYCGRGYKIVQSFIMALGRKAVWIRQHKEIIVETVHIHLLRKCL